MYVGGGGAEQELEPTSLQVLATLVRFGVDAKNPLTKPMRNARMCVEVENDPIALFGFESSEGNRLENAFGMGDYLKRLSAQVEMCDPPVLTQQVG